MGKFLEMNMVTSNCTNRVCFPKAPSICSVSSSILFGHAWIFPLIQNHSLKKSELANNMFILQLFFWVFPRHQYVLCRRFGTMCQFHLQRLEVVKVYRLRYLTSPYHLKNKWQMQTCELYSFECADQVFAEEASSRAAESRFGSLSKGGPATILYTKSEKLSVAEWFGFDLKGLVRK
jgi:hypothetical protein